jgi:cytochrome c oxidase assembly factor CtaG
MAKHLLLMTVAAPLILLGAPVVAVLQGLLQSHPVRRFGRMITHPVSCWFASTAVVIGWHVPAVFELGMRSATWHNLEHMSFLAAGLLFWWPVIRPLPRVAAASGWGVPMYLFLATLPCDALSAFLVFCNRVVYPHYKVAAHSELASLGDQEWAGALMWVWVTFVYLIPAVGIAIHLLSPGKSHSSLTSLTDTASTP